MGNLFFSVFFKSETVAYNTVLSKGSTNTLDENEQEEEKAMQTSVIGFPRIGTLRE